MGKFADEDGLKRCIGRWGARWTRLNSRDIQAEQDTVFVGVGPPEETGTQQGGQLHE